MLVVKNFERALKRGGSQVIDHVTTIQMVQESFKSELSSAFFDHFKVFVRSGTERNGTARYGTDTWL